MDLKRKLADMVVARTEQVRLGLDGVRKTALAEEKERFRHRLKEVERAMSETTLKRLEKERDKLLEQDRQLLLFPEEARAMEEELRNLDAELQRRRTHYQELLEQLKAEQKRILEAILPRRHQMRGQVQVFPIAVEIRLPRKEQTR